MTLQPSGWAVEEGSPRGSQLAQAGRGEGAPRAGSRVEGPHSQKKERRGLVFGLNAWPSQHPRPSLPRPAPPLPLHTPLSLPLPLPWSQQAPRGPRQGWAWDQIEARDKAGGGGERTDRWCRDWGLGAGVGNAWVDRA